MESITLKTLNNELLDKNGLLKVLQCEAKKRIDVRDALQLKIDDLKSQLNTQADARTSAVTSLQNDITDLQADLQDHVPYPATQSQDSETTMIDRGLDGQALVSTGSGTTTWRDLPQTFVSATTVTPDSSYSGANGIALATVAVTAGDGGTQQTTSSEIRMPVAVKNPNKLTVRMPTEETDEETGDTVEGTEDVEYDGSAAVSLDIAGLFENVLTLTNANTVDIETFGQEMDERVGDLEDRADATDSQMETVSEAITSHGCRIETLEDATVGRSITEQQNGSVNDIISLNFGSQAKTNAYTIRETLWENPAPTTAAPAGTTATATFVVNLISSVNNYLFWMIESVTDATNASAPIVSSGLMVGTGNLKGRLCIGSGATNNTYRNFTISQDGGTITFANGNNGSTTNKGQYMLPIKVYGFFPIVTN